ncbi:MAG: extracellular solute-binding protein [Clostridia bacterium]|nr:extracellular solute-binding protein [Clostridia bacterium]
MKKTLALILSLILCIASLAGCGTAEENKKKATADKDDVTISVWSTEAGAQSVWEELVDEWNSTTGDEKNIFIDWVTTTDSTQTDVAEQNGTLPHIMNVSGSQFTQFIERKSVISLNELPGGEEFLKEYDQPGIDGDNLVDGKQYGVYMNVRTGGLAYNKELFKKAGIVDKNGEAKAPETLSEVVEYAKKIRALGSDIYGFAFPLKFGTTYPLLHPLSSYYDGKTPETAQYYIDLDKLTYDYRNYPEQINWLFEMKKDDSIFPGAETLDNDTARAYFAAGTIGMIPAISWDVSVYNNQFKAECDWDVCKYPAPDGRKEFKQWCQQGGCMLIGRKAALENPEETMEVYKFIYSKETRQAMFERGINLSAKTDVLEDYDKDAVDPRFAKFASFVDETKRFAQSEAHIIEGDNFNTLFQKVWIREISLDEATATLKKNQESGLKKAVAQGEYDVERQKRVNDYLQNGTEGLDLTWNH